MHEVKADLWSPEWDLRCITINGFVKNNNECVMGRGVAFQAKKKYPQLAKAIGRLIRESGNHVYHLSAYDIVTFPVKHNWWEKANLMLIRQSIVELETLINIMPEIKKVALPRPGCGNGRLSWEEVKPLVAILDDRFYLITK